MDDTADWRTPKFRGVIVQKLSEAVRSIYTSSFPNPTHMEACAFRRANTKEEYLAYAARIIIYIMKIKYKNDNPQNTDDVNNTGVSGMTDMVDELQNMTLVGKQTDSASVGNVGVVNIPVSNLIQNHTHVDSKTCGNKIPR